MNTYEYFFSVSQSPLQHLVRGFLGFLGFMPICLSPSADPDINATRNGEILEGSPQCLVVLKECADALAVMNTADGLWVHISNHLIHPFQSDSPPQRRSLLPVPLAWDTSFDALSGLPYSLQQLYPAHSH